MGNRSNVVPESWDKGKRPLSPKIGQNQAKIRPNLRVRLVILRAILLRVTITDSGWTALAVGHLWSPILLFG